VHSILHPRWASALLAFAVAFGVIGSSARAASPLTFSAPQSISANPLTEVSCPTTSFCAALDDQFTVLTSVDPLDASAAWTANTVGIAYKLAGLTCPTSTFCLVGDAAGAIHTSSDPADSSAQWQTVQIEQFHPITAASCPSATRCVAVDNDGRAYSTPDPTGDALAWTPKPIDGVNSLTAISCPTISLCVAVDKAGNAVTSTSPTFGSAPWQVAAIDPGNHLTAVSCPSETLCVASDMSGYVLVSTNPTGGVSAWTPIHITNHFLNSVSCATGPLCLAVDPVGNASDSLTPTDALGGWSDPTEIDPGPSSRSLSAVACPSPVACVAVDQLGNVVAGTADHTLTVATSGAGTVSGAGIGCPPICAKAYLSGTAVTLGAQAAAGSMFTGWGGSCAGVGNCTLTLSADAGVTATFAVKPPPAKPPPAKPAAKSPKTHPPAVHPPNTAITAITVHSRARSAVIRARGVGSVTRLQCSVVRTPVHHRGPHATKLRFHFKRCRSPLTVRHLARGAYTVAVRAQGPGGLDPTPARRAFRIA
jgi:List-Bact-rpt repeat protein